jgi:hypothetical protein
LFLDGNTREKLGEEGEGSNGSVLRNPARGEQEEEGGGGGKLEQHGNCQEQVKGATHM